MKTLTLRQASNSTSVLLLCLAAGALCGIFAAPAGAFAYFVGQLYLAIVNMAAVPLLVVATFFGLRQVLDLPRPGLPRWRWPSWCCAPWAARLAASSRCPANI
jgi:hypothetical protein